MNVSTLSTNHSRFDTQSNPARFRSVIALPLSVCMAVFMLLQTGCLALNIPSQRNHDANDSGGILGAWEDPARPGRVLKEILMGPPPESDLGSCDDVDPFGSEAYGSDYTGGPHPSEPAPPEVPWPKYHPVPTRPVFGGDTF